MLCIYAGRNQIPPTWPRPSRHRWRTLTGRVPPGLGTLKRFCNQTRRPPWWTSTPRALRESQWPESTGCTNQTGDLTRLLIAPAPGCGDHVAGGDHADTPSTRPAADHDPTGCTATVPPCRKDVVAPPIR